MPATREHDIDRMVACRDSWRVSLPRRIYLLFALLTLAFIPRVWLASRLTTVCPDATVYIQQAEAISEGSWQTSTLDIHRWMYPTILAGLHACGLSWQMAGQLWGVLVATLVVLPIYIWVERIGSPALAVAAAVLYAVHPEFIEWAPEVIRDATFWLCWATAAALLLQLDPGRIQIVLGILAVFVSALFRLEGLAMLLVIPSLLKTTRPSRSVNRTTMVVLLAVALSFGLLTITTRVVSSAGPMATLSGWLMSWFQPVDGATLVQRSTTFVRTVLSGFHPIFFVLALVGWFICPDEARPALSKRSVSTIAVLVLWAMWMHLWRTETLEPRYALPLVVIGMPWMAAGLITCGRSLASGWRVAHGPSWGVATLAAAIGLVGCMDALTTRYDSREGRAALGTWIRSEFGGRATVAGHRDLERMVGYYAGSWTKTLSSRSHDAKLDGIRVVLLSHRGSSAAVVQGSLQRARKLGFFEVQLPNQIDRLYPGVRVLFRPDQV